MPKNKNKTEKTWTKFDLISNTLLEKYYLKSIKLFQ